jgi:hypothetical protein
MPIPPTWIQRLPQILAAVRHLSLKELDREQIVSLFRIKRRAALLLMKQLEPKMVRGSWRIERSRLKDWLEEQMRDSQRELDRRDRMTRALIAADMALPRPPGAFLSLSVTQEMRNRAAQGLPQGVSLEVGRPSKLEVQFQTLEELAEKLLQVGLALDCNFDHYTSLLDLNGESGPQSEDNLERMDAEYFKTWRPPSAL